MKNKEAQKQVSFLVRGAPEPEDDPAPVEGGERDPQALSEEAQARVRARAWLEAQMRRTLVPAVRARLREEGRCYEERAKKRGPPERGTTHWNSRGALK
jgi:hypothetical protein